MQSCPTWMTTSVLLAAAAVRAAAMVAMYDNLAADPDGYRALAQNLLEHGVLGRGDVPSAYRPPLYPLAVAACLAVDKSSSAAIAALHWWLGVATIYLTYRLGLAARLGRWSLAAAMLVAVDPILVKQSTLVMTETLATWLATAALVCLAAADRRPSATSGAIAGAALGLAALCRPTFLAWIAAVAAVWLAREAVSLLRRAPRTPTEESAHAPHASHDRPKSKIQNPKWTRKLEALAAMLVAAACVLAPWAFRNWRVFGTPVVGTTHSGYTLLLANNNIFFTDLAFRARERGQHPVFDAQTFDRHVTRIRREMDVGSGPRAELAYDRNEARLAWREIARQPVRFVQAVQYRMMRLWGWTPLTPDLADSPLPLAIGAFYIIEFALVLYGLWSVGRRLVEPEWLWGATLAATLTAVHAVYWTDLRMRAPVVPYLALLAAAGAAAAWASRCAQKVKSSNDLREANPP